MVDELLLVGQLLPSCAADAIGGECEQQTVLQLQPCVSRTRTHLLLLIIVVLVYPVVVMAVVSASAVHYWRSRSLQAAHFWQLKSSMRADAEDPACSQRNECRQFSYHELDAATNGFHQNALLGAGSTGDYTAAVEHFGSVRVAKVSQRAVVSSLGLVDPEYGVMGELTEKSDVFSYGMLLLVFVSGRRILEPQPSGTPQLLTWMQLQAKAELSELVDPRLDGNFDKHEISLCAQIVLLCIRIQPELRPSMSEVRRILEGTHHVPISGSLDTPLTSSQRVLFL